MKKIFILSLITIVFIGDLVSQAPNLMSYQAVIWDANGNLVSEKTVNIKISILQGSFTGTSMYSETHKIQTNINGLVSLMIGGGTNATGKITDINWGGGSYFLKTETDPTGGGNFTITGTTQLVSVPYALIAGNIQTPNAGLPGQVLKLDELGKPYWAGESFPTVNTISVNSISTTTAISGGNVSTDGGAAITTRGVVWSTNTKPTISLTTKTSNGTGPGTFSSSLTGLSPNTAYYVRAYATNSAGTGYGNEVIFITNSTTVSPTLTTSLISAITSTTAISGGNVSSDGGASITTRGVVWSTSTNPTISLTTKTSNASGTGAFISILTGLSPNTTYYVRAYATNSAGTGYGNEVTFTTSNSSTEINIPCPGTPIVKDIDGNTYNTVQIGTQCWTKENLKVTKYNDGTTIPLDTSGGTNGNGTGQTWGSRPTGARTIYAKDNTNLSTYGYLYNWYAVKGIVTEGSASYKNLCPSGWHIPSDTEWTTLANYLGSYQVAGGKMKTSDTTFWYSPNRGATNESGFSALPGGFRYSDGRFYDDRIHAQFWSATEFNNNAMFRVLAFYSPSLNTLNGKKLEGNSIRCLKDSTITSNIVNPSINTTQLSAIMSNSAISGGNITSDGGSAVTTRGVVWSTSVNPTISLTTKTSNGTGAGTFSSSLTGLTPNTTYYVRAYATNSAGTGYGNEIIFTTSTALVLPNVSAIYLSSITTTTATSVGNISSDGGAAVTSRGVVWSSTSNPTISLSTKTNDGSGTGVFSSTLAGLTPNTTYYVRGYATNSVGTGYGNEITFKTITSLVLPNVSTISASSISTNTAASGGNITSDVGAAITSRGVVWSTSANPTISLTTKTSNGTGTGTFSSALTGLTPNTTYYVRAYATNSAGTGYGNQVIFTTSTSLVLPTLSTISVSSITTTTATSGGNVSADGGSAVTTRGVVWSTNTNPIISLTTKTSNGTGTGTFSSSLTGLTPNTTYYVRAYATNSVGTGYGNEVTFTSSSTTVPPTVTTLTISATTFTTSISGGNISSDGGSAVTLRGVVWSTSANPTISLTTKTSNGSGAGTFSSSLTGLSPNTTYYVRAYATNSVGTGYGEELKFINNSLPTVVTISIDTFGSIFSKYTGKVVFDGGSPIIERGVVLNNCGKPILPFNQNDLDQYNRDSLFTDSKEHKSHNDIDANEISRKNLEIKGNEKKRFEKIKVQFSESSIEQEINVEIENGLVFWSDDILLFSEKEFDLIKLEKGNIHSIKSLRWPNGIIPYSISNNHSNANDILEAIKITNNQTNINLIPRTNETNYVEFVEEDKNRCYAYLGMIGGRQRINVNNCGIAAIIHEIGHALGMWHEHQRNDRDDFITIQYENIIEEYKYAFDKKLDNILPIGNYDYFSIMHYYSFSFSKNGNPTINPKRPPATFDMIPYPEKLSEGDIFAINSIYKNKNNCVSIYYPNDKGLGDFSGFLNSLNSNQKYYLRTYATNSSGTGYGNEITFITGSIPPTVTTTSISSITSTTAISVGNVSADGGSAVTSRGLVWSTSANPTISLTTKTSNGSGTGSFISSITGLSPNTTYYVRAYATNSAGTGYGNEIAFKTSTSLVLPTVSTKSASSITTTTAASVGNISSDGGSAVTSRGVVWSTSPSPTISLSTKTSNGTGIGSFTSLLTNLTPKTTYYVRAYATSSAGTGYGNEVTFTTSNSSTAMNIPCPGTPTVKDIDGNTYNTVQIETQCWTKENLKVTKYNDGTNIPLDTSGGIGGNGTGQTWGSRSTGARTIYANNNTNLSTYGYLYNWYAVKGIVTESSTSYKNLCPTGWHIPSDVEWTTLTNYLGGESVVGGKMKSSGTTNWNSPNTGATNESGFSALPGGFRDGGSSFYSIRNIACFWSATEINYFFAWYRVLYNHVGNVERTSYYNKSLGASVRCLRD